MGVFEGETTKCREGWGVSKGAVKETREGARR